MVGALFIRPMFDAIVAGKKTKTSRFGDKQLWKIGQELYIKEPVYLWGTIGSNPQQKQIVWREHDLSYTGVTYAYDQCVPPDRQDIFWKFKQKLFCPEAAARYGIRITNVGLRPIGKMKVNDFIAEGIERFFALDIESGKGEHQYKVHTTPNQIYSNRDPNEVFKYILRLTDKKFEYNPDQLAWVYDFELFDLPRKDEAANTLDRS